MKVARRKFTTPQTVIVSKRLKPGTERSKSAKPTLTQNQVPAIWLTANCQLLTAFFQ